MSHNNDWLFEMRGETLAIIHLTRRSDLDVLKLSAGRRPTGYDLLVRVADTDAAIGTPEFGIEIRGMDRPLSDIRKSSIVRNLYQRRGGLTERLSGEHLPICLFVFNIDTEEGVYAWLVEPSPSGQTRLVPQTELLFEALDQGGLDRIVNRVSNWQQARERRLNEPLHAQSAD